MIIIFLWCFAWELDVLVLARVPQISYRNDLGQKGKPCRHDLF